MQLNVSGHHVEVTDSLREYVESKVNKIASHFDLVSDVHCILTVEKLRHKAEATVHVNGGTIYADHTSMVSWIKLKDESESTKRSSSITTLETNKRPSTPDSAHDLCG